MAAAVTDKPGPVRSARWSAPYRPPRNLAPRCTKAMLLPPAVTIAVDVTGQRQHLFRQHDGRWAPCAGRRTCRECLREQASKTTRERIDEALEIEHGVTLEHAIAKGNVIDALCSIETEFQIRLETMDINLATIAADVDRAVLERSNG